MPSTNTHIGFLYKGTKTDINTIMDEITSASIPTASGSTTGWGKLYGVNNQRLVATITKSANQIDDNIAEVSVSLSNTDSFGLVLDSSFYNGSRPYRITGIREFNTSTQETSEVYIKDFTYSFVGKAPKIPTSHGNRLYYENTDNVACGLTGMSGYSTIAFAFSTFMWSYPLTQAEAMGDDATYLPCYIIEDTESSEPTKYKVTSTLENCTLTPTDTEIDEGTETTFTVTANDGYEFQTAPTINGSEMTKTSNTEYTSTITVSSDVDIVANAIKSVTYYTVNSTLTNCTRTPTDSQIAEGTETTFTVTANDGYTFNTVPTINGSSMSKASDTVYTATITVNSNVTIVASADKIPSTYSATYDLSNATITPNNSVFTENEVVTFTATANTGYEFSNNDYVTVNGTKFTIADDKKTATATITVTGTVSVIAHALIVQTHIITITGTLTNCTCNYNSGDDLVEGKAVTFTANDGYHFDNLQPRYRVKQSSATTYDELTGELNGTGEQTLIDGTQVTLYVRNNTNIEILDDIKATETPLEVINGVNIYELTEDKLRDVMRVRFTVGNTDTGTGTQTEDTEPIDYGKWITNLYYMPFSTDAIINAQRAYIVLGNKNTELVTDSLVSQFDIDVGNISVPDFSSSYNAEHRAIKLFLPFISDTVNIDSEYSGHTISIKYHIDLIDETISVIVSDESNPFMYNKYQFGRNLPFFSTENGNTNLNYNNDAIDNTIYTAFIIVTDNNIVQLNDAPKDTFIRVSHVESLNTSATQEEQDLIRSLLDEGVIIK